MFSPSFFLSKSICTGDLRLLPLMNFFFFVVVEFHNQHTYPSVDIALKFDSIDVPRTMSRVLRRQMMVVKENTDVDGCAFGQILYFLFGYFASNFFSSLSLSLSLSLPSPYRHFFYTCSYFKSFSFPQSLLHQTR